MRLVIAGLLAIVCLDSFATCAWYVEAGMGVHNEIGDAPEFNGSNPIGSFGVGYQCQADNIVIDFYPLKHDSSIPDRERGLGYNRAGITIRYLFGG